MKQVCNFLCLFLDLLSKNVFSLSLSLLSTQQLVLSYYTLYDARIIVAQRRVSTSYCDSHKATCNGIAAGVCQELAECHVRCILCPADRGPLKDQVGYSAVRSQCPSVCHHYRISTQHYCTCVDVKCPEEGALCRARSKRPSFRLHSLGTGCLLIKWGDFKQNLNVFTVGSVTCSPPPLHHTTTNPLLTLDSTGSEKQSTLPPNLRIKSINFDSLHILVSLSQ